jgi:Protein of unknown function (DUF3800)
MLTAFFDDSGTDGQGPFCALAGYVATADQWINFSDAWDIELRAEPKITYLKMSEANSKKGDFLGWDIEARDKKILLLTEIINRHVIGGMACIISHKAYNAAGKNYLPDTINNPYWMCFQKAVIETIQIYGHEQGGGKINFVFDTQGIGYERRAAMIHDGLRKTLASSGFGSLLGSLTFASDRDLLPLQAADLLAWHVRRHADMKSRGESESRPTNEALQKIPIILSAWEPQEISDFVEDYQRTHPYSPINRPDLH